MLSLKEKVTIEDWNAMVDFTEDLQCEVAALKNRLNAVTKKNSSLQHEVNELKTRLQALDDSLTDEDELREGIRQNVCGGLQALFAQAINECLGSQTIK